jgi:non-ribosomal peptide synthetase component F
VDVEDTAYIAFTSGSTGEPKGVMVTHKNLTAYVDAANDHYQITAADKLLQFSSLSFDIFVEELFCSICHGATLQFRQAPDKTYTKALLAYITEHKTSVLTLPTAYFHLLCEDVASFAPGSFEALRLIIVGGEKLSSEMLTKWRAGIKGGMSGGDQIKST